MDENTIRILREYKNGVLSSEAIKLAPEATLKRVNEAMLRFHDKLKPALPCWTSTHIKYEAGATEAEIWNEGGKPEKIFFPLKDGWYLPDKKYGIPNGKPSNSDNPNALYLWRWQDKSYNGFVVRWYDWFDGNFRRYVVCSCGADDRYGVVSFSRKYKDKSEPIETTKMGIFDSFEKESFDKF
jgi:hypothetical protein